MCGNYHGNRGTCSSTHYLRADAIEQVVTLELRPYGFTTVGVDSPDDLVKNKFGEYGETQKGWTAEDAKGFIKVTSTPLRLYYANHKDEERIK